MENLSNLTKNEFKKLERDLEEFRKKKKLEYENSYSDFKIDVNSKYEIIFRVINNINRLINNYINDHGFKIGYVQYEYETGTNRATMPYIPIKNNTNNILLEKLTNEEKEYVLSLLSDIYKNYFKISIKLKNKYIDQIKKENINTREYFNHVLKSIYDNYIKNSRISVKENNNPDIIEEKVNLELSEDDKRKLDSLNEITVENGSTSHEEKIAKEKINNIINKKKENKTVKHQETIEEDDFTITIYGDNKTYIVPSKISRFMDNCSDIDDLGRKHYWSYYTRIDSSIIHLQDEYYNDRLKEEKEIIYGLENIQDFLESLYSETIKVKYTNNIIEEENTKDFIDIIKLHLGIATKIKIFYEDFIDHQNNFSKVIIRDNGDEILLSPFHLEIYFNDETNELQISSDDPNLLSEIDNYEYNRTLKDNEIVYVNRIEDVVYIDIVKIKSNK